MPLTQNKYGFQGDLTLNKAKVKKRVIQQEKYFSFSKDINADGKINIDDIKIF